MTYKTFHPIQAFFCNCVCGACPRERANECAMCIFGIQFQMRQFKAINFVFKLYQHDNKPFSVHIAHHNHSTTERRITKSMHVVFIHKYLYTHVNIHISHKGA